MPVHTPLVVRDSRSGSAMPVEDVPFPAVAGGSVIDWLEGLRLHNPGFKERGVSMSDKTVYCMAGSDEEAAAIYQRLRDEGFGERRITVLVRDEDGRSREYRPDARDPRADPSVSRRTGR